VPPQRSLTAAERAEVAAALEAADRALAEL
jgi:hypothetical protein